jgi:DNA-binding PadR family transcriptional regulator
MDETPERSVGEWAVLGLLAEAPAHGFAIAKELAPHGELGRVVTVRRPLVYRAIDRLVADRLAVPDRTEPGEGGPAKTVHRITDHGDAALDRWLAQPVTHIRDLRLAFLVKVSLLLRSGRPAAQLVAAQRDALAEALGTLIADETGGDVVDTWRRHNAAAVSSFLDELETRT